MSFPRYPAYKPSGVEWMGEIPEHWEALALRRLIREVTSGTSVNAIDEPAEPGQPGVLKTSCVYTGEFRPEENKAILESELDRATCPLLAGSLVVSRMNTPDLVGAAGLVMNDDPFLFLPDRLWQVRFQDCDPQFMNYWCKSVSYRSQVQLACSGTSSSMQNLSQDNFYSFIAPLPPKMEQLAIARFLDRETAKIDALIAEQQRLIELLQEKRQAVISHAVTKGLNPDAPIKDSGVEWLGAVPEHWEVTPLMRMTQPTRPIMYGIVLPGPDVGEGVPILKGGNVKPSRLRLECMARTTPEIEAPFARARLRAGDLIYGIRGSIGDCEIVPIELEGCNITQDVARIAPLSSLCPSWLRYAMLSRPVAEGLACGSLGAAVKGINIFDLKRARIPVPPTDEMKCIADFLKSEDSRLLSLSLSAETAIGLLQERRSALISAAVTGQIDVRGLVPEAGAA
jgi:type I restriction enzyme, S subunit